MDQLGGCGDQYQAETSWQRHIPSSWLWSATCRIAAVVIEINDEQRSILKVGSIFLQASHFETPAMFARTDTTWNSILRDFWTVPS